jgi:hypothetical protein
LIVRIVIDTRVETKTPFYIFAKSQISRKVSKFSLIFAFRENEKRVFVSTLVSMTILCQYDTAEAGDLEFDRLWLP